MRFLEIDLWTNTLEEQALFYKDALGLDIQINENTFSVQIGWTKLTFRRSVKKFI